MPITLSITEKFIDNSIDQGLKVNSVNLIIIQHLLCDTENFINLLNNKGFEIYKLIGIEYSSKTEVAQRLRKSKIDVIIPKFNEIENIINDIITNELTNNNVGAYRKFIIHEVGGYCVPILKRNADLFGSNCAGILEDTKQGLWKYKDIVSLPVPIMQIAECNLKEIEAKYVGEAVARAVEYDLLEMGMSLWGYRVGVLGFGSIGEPVASSLRCRGAIVSCFDPDPLKTIKATIQGFSCPGRNKLLQEAQLIVGTTGINSINYDELPILNNDVILASGSSKNHEFPMDKIKMTAHESTKITESITQYAMPWGKGMQIASDGFPINFSSISLPMFMSDLLFCQIAASLIKLMTHSLPFGIHKLSEDEERVIAGLWLEQYC